MKKSTHTPGSKASEQKLEPGWDREIIIPTEPKRIFTALNGASFLHFHGGNDPITTLSNEEVFSLRFGCFCRGEIGSVTRSGITDLTRT